MNVDKRTVARVLEEISRYLELGEANKFKTVAFRNAARAIEAIDLPIEDLIASGDLYKTRGIGKATGAIVEEIVRTGKSRYLEELRAQYPPGIFDLMRIPGLGLRKIGTLYSRHGIASVEELERACRDQKIAQFPGFGLKTQQKVLEGIESMRKGIAKALLSHAFGFAESLLQQIVRIDGVSDAVITGPARRRLEVIDVVSILAVSDDPDSATRRIEKVGAIHDPEIVGSRTIRGTSLSNLSVEVRVCAPDEFPTMLLFTTGSPEFVDSVVEDAKSAGYELTAEGLQRGGKRKRLKDEQDLFKVLGIPSIEPELREPENFVERQEKRTKLVTIDDIRGTFHVHTVYSDGRGTISEMLAAARDRGFEYVGISDHSKTATYARGLTEERLAKQHAEIEAHRREFLPMRVFKGTEADILPNGDVDYGPETLPKFDFVIASVHSRFNMEKDEMTERVIRALRNPFVTFLGHLTGRLLLSRAGYSLDLDRIFTAAAENGVIVEINGDPRRLELDWRHIRKALDRGVVFSIHPDAHSMDSLDYVRLGVNVARKGGLSPEHVFNTLPPEAIEEHFARKKAMAAS